MTELSTLTNRLYFTFMKKITAAFLGTAMVSVFALTLPSCQQKAETPKEDFQAENTELNNKLRQTLATQDSLFALINDITQGMTQIKEIERIVSTPGALNGDTPSRKDQLRNDMLALQQSLQERRQRLAELEKQLNQSSAKNGTLLTTISNLKAQIAEQQTNITTLTNQLAEANIKITTLGTQVDSLSTVASTAQEGRQIAEQQAVELNNELNTCYYALGSKGELKKNNIIRTGFLRKTKILPSDFDADYFTKADKRTLTTIPLHSRKGQVITNQPKDSYTIQDDGSGQKVLRITNPERFWSVSNYLVVQID